MENKIRELCKKIDNLRVGEEFRVKSNCKGIDCCECPFVHTSCEYITEESFEIYQATARKWLEDNKPVEQRKFKVGDKVVLASGDDWINGDRYKTIKEITSSGVYILVGGGERFFVFNSDELELYQQEQPKAYNIIEALKLPIGTKFKITYSNGSETTGCLGKYGLEEGENNVLLIGSLKEEARVTGYLANATYTVIEDKPLSFFEAVEQADKKRFRVEHELYKITGCHTLLTHTNFLKELNNNEVKEIMLNAKCYLEE